jgi:hydroxymethylbilane synthase
VHTLRPDVQIVPLRGNVDTRLRKALEGQYDAIVLAGAGLTRLGLDQHVTEWLPLDVMLPAPGQGALAVQCQSTDQTTLSLLAALEDESARRAVTAERAFLSGLGGGCAVPVAAYAAAIGGQRLAVSGQRLAISDQQLAISLTGLVISEDGKRAIKVSGEGMDALALGHELAQKAVSQGADEILAAGVMK